MAKKKIGGIERVAIEIRHLQRSEVYELQEYFSKSQKGSSAMPHKKNPILSENLTGLARMVRSFFLVQRILFLLMSLKL